MVRMRFQFPPAAPAPKPQRFPVGTRVANPIEGRTGHVEGYDSAAGVYHLVFNDGHQEDVPDAAVDRFVIRKPPPPPAVGAATRRLEDVEVEEEDSDPQALLGVAVVKTVRDYEGNTTSVGGCVETFLPMTGYYRVVYENGLVEDMRPEETRRAVAKAARKRKAQELGREGKSEDDDPTEVEARKKQRVGLDGVRERPLESERLPSRQAAYEILRKVLRAILVQADVKPLRTEKQRLAVSNDEIQPKKALENFVDADGLKFLQKVLALWMKKSETHRGAMLVLKILAALPGVTAELVLASQIGKTLRRISQLSRQLDHVDSALGDLADWVIYTWKRDVVAKAGLASAKARTNQQAAELQGESQPKLYVLPATAQLKAKQREAMTAHLRKLLTTEPEPPVEDTEPAIFLANYNSLGSIDKRRPVRQIIHIESLVERVRKRHEDQAAKSTDDEAGDDENSPSKSLNGAQTRKIRFRRRDEIIQFSIHVAPVKLLATDRTKIMDARMRQRSDSLDDIDGGEDANQKLPPPNKLAAPVKPILKNKREEVMVPYSRIAWT